MIAWLLMAAQAVLVLGVPAGLMVCREENGASHIEWVASGCCLEEQLAAGSEGSSASVFENLFEEVSSSSPCDDAACVEAPLEVEPALSSVRSRWQASNAPAAAGPCRSSWAISSTTTGPSVAGLADEGPPRQTSLALRAVVLNL